MTIRPPIKIHGGKYYLSKWIIEQFPHNYQALTYVEPFCGGISVLLNKERSAKEIINDIDDGVISILKTLRDEPKEFIGRMKHVKYCENTFNQALKRSKEAPDEDYVNRAVNEFIVRRMSRGGMKKAFAWSDRLRGGQPGDVNAWETIIDQLPAISDRLQGVIILREDFRKISEVWDEEDSLLYLDPPYLPSTRSDGAQEVYDKEMTVEDHIAMLNMIKNSRGKVVLSGYQSTLYTRMLNKENWRCKKKNIANNSSQTKTKARRTECLWLNYPAKSAT
jgi:DNA adenine methylase